MKVLVVSDSHGSKNTLEEIIDQNLSAKYIIHLGDGEYDMDFAPYINSNAEIIMVRGNCDIGSSLPTKAVKYIEGHTLFITHGYEQRVKCGVYELLDTASKYLSDIVLYGHTHVPVNEKIGDIHLFNPGSVKDGIYGIIDLNEENVTFEHKFLKK